jgi:hypothetical protein
MSLISWLIWSSSLATGSGVAGTLADAEAEPEAKPGVPDEVEPEDDGVSDSTAEADAETLELAGGGVDGTGVALCLLQPAKASATSSIAAATVAGRAWWRINFEALHVADRPAAPIIAAIFQLANGPVASAV